MIEILKDRNFDDINLNEQLKFEDLSFKNEQLKKMTEEAVKQKADLFYQLNASFFKIAQYKSEALQKMPGSVALLII